MTRHASKRVVRRLGWLLVPAVLALAACNGIKPSQDHAREMTFDDFASAMRWGSFDVAYGFVDPATKKEHPLTDLDRERFKQIEISGYDVTATDPGTDTYDRQITLDLVNRNTQTPRTVVYHEHWRWDPAIKRWWLVSGLPDISPQP